MGHYALQTLKVLCDLETIDITVVEIPYGITVL